MSISTALAISSLLMASRFSTISRPTRARRLQRSATSIMYSAVSDISSPSIEADMEGNCDIFKVEYHSNYLPAPQFYGAKRNDDDDLQNLPGGAVARGRTRWSFSRLRGRSARRLHPFLHGGTSG